MKALIYHGPGRISLEDARKPTLQAATDAIVRITTTTLCGTDLHIIKGDVPTVTEGRILGHEGVGIVEEVGNGVSRFAVGDRVVISCITTCGQCPMCQRGLASHCENGGWNLGHTIDGTQAGWVRVPWANTSLHHIPAEADAGIMVMLSDVLPTGYECGVLSGRVKPGDTVAIIGAGPIGLAVLLTTQFYATERIIVVDVDDHRLTVAKQLGATDLINNTDGQAVAAVMALTQGRGADVVVEAVGVPATFELCQFIVAVGGHIANVGVHGTSVPLHLETLWSRNITLSTSLVDATSTPQLLRAILSGGLSPGTLVTHHFALDNILEAYAAFGDAARSQALKVIITSDPV
jgi:alcohol dehydrogenase